MKDRKELTPEIISTMIEEYQKILPFIPEFINRNNDNFDLLLFLGASASTMAQDIISARFRFEISYILLSHDACQSMYMGGIRSVVEDTARIIGDANRVLLVDDYINRGLKVATLGNIFTRIGTPMHYVALTCSALSPRHDYSTILQPNNELLFEYLFLRSKGKI